MVRYKNGTYIVRTAEENAEYEKNREISSIPYEQRVEARIRERYTLGQELALQRQREDKPEEFAEYYAYCEKVKAEERNK